MFRRGARRDGEHPVKKSDAEETQTAGSNSGGLFFSPGKVLLTSRKMKRRRTKSGYPEMPRIQYSKDRRIILLDQQPLREEAGAEAKRFMREVNEHSEKLAEFDRTIRPAYERWEAENLGPLLDEERRLNAKIADLESRIHFADIESLFTGRDPFEIFEETVREDEEKDEASPPPEQEEAPEEPDPDADFDPEERDFRSYVRFIFGDDPDDLGPAKYKRLFEDYRRWRAKMGGVRSTGRPQAEDIPARVKEIYRILVRRLHPDTGRDRSNPQTRKLWDDLQAAYSALDLERMEVLLAITDLHESGSAVRSTLYHLRQVTRQLRVQLDGLKVRLRQIKKAPAWTFWHAKDRQRAGEKIRAAVVARVAEAKENLGILEEEVRRWKEQAQRDRERTAKNSPKKSKKKNFDDGQQLFDI